MLLADDAPVGVEQRASYSIGDPALAEFFGLAGSTLAGVVVNEKAAVGLTALYRAVSIVSGTIAGLPLRSLRTLGTGARERVDTWLDNPAGPGSDLTQFEWVELVMVHLLLHGNAYLLRVYNGAGAVVGLTPVPPASVTVKAISNAEELAAYGGPAGLYRKWFVVALADGSSRDLTQADVEHVTALSTDGLVGLSPIEAHRQALGTAIAGDRAAARLFGSGLLLGGLVSGDEDLAQSDAEEAVAALKAKLAGADHAGDIAFINARLKFTPWTIPPADAQFIESRAHQIEEVARIYGVATPSAGPDRETDVMGDRRRGTEPGPGHLHPQTVDVAPRTAPVAAPVASHDRRVRLHRAPPAGPRGRNPAAPVAGRGGSVDDRRGPADP